MISYVITHYNRIFFLDAHIKLISDYLPSGSQIIIIDDGSHPNIINKLETLGTVITRNRNESCLGNLFNQMTKILTNDYCLIAEDDFWFYPGDLEFSYHKGQFHHGNGYDLQWKKNNLNMIEQSCILLKDNKEIQSVNLASPNRPTGTISSGWYLQNGNSYLNWPFVMRSEFLTGFNFSSYVNNKKVRDKEEVNFPFTRDFNKKCSRSEKWAASSKYLHYLHVGYPLSLSTRYKSPTRNSQYHLIQKSIFGGEKYKKDDFIGTLNKQHLNNNFFFDTQDLYNYDFATCWKNAFTRLLEKTNI